MNNSITIGLVTAEWGSGYTDTNYIKISVSEDSTVRLSNGYIDERPYVKSSTPYYMPIVATDYGLHKDTELLATDYTAITDGSSYTSIPVRVTDENGATDIIYVDAIRGAGHDVEAQYITHSEYETNKVINWNTNLPCSFDLYYAGTQEDRPLYVDGNETTASGGVYMRYPLDIIYPTASDDFKIIAKNTQKHDGSGEVDITYTVNVSTCTPSGVYLRWQHTTGEVVYGNFVINSESTEVETADEYSYISYTDGGYKPNNYFGNKNAKKIISATYPRATGYERWTLRALPLSPAVDMWTGTEWVGITAELDSSEMTTKTHQDINVILTVARW